MPASASVRPPWKILKLAVGTLLLLLGVALVGVPAEAASINGTCQDVDVPVALAQGQPATSVIAGTLCIPDSPASETTVDVLTPGSTYDRTYWDFPYQSPKYSYVERTLAQGRSTFAFDRIGSSRSSTPPSLQVTVGVEAFTMHQVIQWLRQTKGYGDVTLLGHSAGSGSAVLEAARYADVDRVALTGFLHSLTLNLVVAVGTSPFPAPLDRQFADRGLDVGYITTQPDKRGGAFYFGQPDGGVIAYDEAHKSFMSLTNVLGTMETIVAPPLLNESRNISVPVLTAIGDHDIFCGPPLDVDCTSAASVKAHEAPYFTGSSSYSTIVVANTGHDLTLHPSADQSFNAIDGWIRDH
jgi:pimeloyl-ACP methyl ester carboxylesterase